MRLQHEKDADHPGCTRPGAVAALSLTTGGGNKATRVQIGTDTSEEDGGTNNMHEHWRTEDRTRAVRTMAAKEQRGDWL